MSFKRGQLTLFVIVGIVVIAIFAFLFFAVQTVSRSQLETQVDQIFQQIVSSTSLNYYVSLCAQQSLEEGLDLIGEQGGKIFESQGGIYPPQDYLILNLDKSYNVSYAIQRERNVLDTPEYPCKSSDIDNSSPCFMGCCFSYPPGTFYRYSLSLLPPLCKTAVDCGFEARACPSGSTFCIPRSIQGQLEEFISNRTKECVRLDSIIGINTTYSVQEGNVSTTLNLGDNDVSASINFPILIRLAGRAEPFARLAKFSATSPVRLKKIYQLVDDMIKKNTERLDFNMLTDANQSFAYSQDFQIIRYNNVHIYDDVYRVNDTRQSTFPFFFQFAAENRIPILSYVGNAQFLDQCGTVFDLYVLENSTLNLTPLALDADFDNLSINYSGWKADYNETFTISFQNGCLVQAPATFESLATNLWHSSLDYQQTGGRRASVEIGQELGIHNITIRIGDSEFSDWQLVRILVDDVLQASGKINTTYSDINCPGCLSFEDPATLKADLMELFNPGINYLFRWRIIPSPVIYGPDVLDTVIFPLQYTIKDIQSQLLPIYGGALPTNPPYTTEQFELEVTGGGATVTDVNSIDIYQCLPHRNPSPSYPYHTTSDPFEANHTCCDKVGSPGSANWGIIRSSSVVCFDANTTYAIPSRFNSSRYFNNDFDNGTAPSGFSPKYYDKQNSDITGSITNSQYENDVFSRSFKRKCDGNRGNICTGDADEERRQVAECSDNNRGTGGQYRCSGPLFLTEENNSFGCMNYSAGTTFEFLESGAGNGLCNTTQKCTDGTSYNANGPLKCQAACSSGTDAGKCLAASACSCDSSCGANCTGPGQSKWAGFTCYYGSCTGSCNFASSAKTECPATQGNCLNESTRYGKCYTGVSCTSSGSPQANIGAYCPLPGTISRSTTNYLAPLNTTTNWCYHGSSQSCSGLNCNLQNVNSTNITRAYSCTLVAISENGISCFNQTTSTCNYRNNNPCDSSAGWKTLFTQTCQSGESCTTAGCSSSG